MSAISTPCKHRGTGPLESVDIGAVVAAHIGVALNASPLATVANATGPFRLAVFNVGDETARASATATHKRNLASGLDPLLRRMTASRKGVGLHLGQHGRVECRLRAGFATYANASVEFTATLSVGRDGEHRFALHTTDTSTVHAKSGAMLSYRSVVEWRVGLGACTPELARIAERHAKFTIAVLSAT